MKRATHAVVFFLLAAASITPVLAHNGFDHVRGVVTAISAASITIHVSAQTTKTLTISAATTFEKSGAPGHLADLKVGSRVVVDVPEKTSEARLIKFGAATPAPGPSSAPRKPAD